MGQSLAKKRKKVLSKDQIAFSIFKYSVFLILGSLFVFPTYWMVINSFKPQQQIYADMDSMRTFLPSFDFGTLFDSYSKLFTAFELFGRALINSVVYAAITIVGVLLINSFAGYALSRFSFPGSKVVVTIIILILVVPVETSVVPLYSIIFRLGLLKTNTVFGSDLRYVAYLLPGIVSPFYIFMFRQFFLGIPKELEEAARIDGAGRLKTFFRIIVPNSAAVFGTVTIFTFMGIWNDYLWPQLIFTDQKYFPLQVFLQLVNDASPHDLSMVMAALTFSTIPIVVVYIFFQKYIVEGVAFSGLK